MTNFSKNGIKTIIAIAPSMLCSVLIGCNSGNSNVSGATKNSVSGVATDGNEIIKDQISNLPSNCVKDDINNPTVETCFYMPNAQNGYSSQLSSIPSYAKYISVLGQGGGGGGGSSSANDSSMYNGGGISGGAGGAGVITASLNNNLTSSNQNISIAVGAGGGFGTGGEGSWNGRINGFNVGGTGAHSYITISANAGNGGYGNARNEQGGGGGGGGETAISLDNFSSAIFAAPGGGGGGGGGSIGYSHDGGDSISDSHDGGIGGNGGGGYDSVVMYGGGQGGLNDNGHMGGGNGGNALSASGGGGGGGAATCSDYSHGSGGGTGGSFGIGGGGGGSTSITEGTYGHTGSTTTDTNGGGYTNGCSIGGTGGGAGETIFSLTASTNNLYINDLLNNGGAPRVCDQEYHACNANNGNSGFAIVTLSAESIVSTTNNVTLNFVSPSQNNVCMLIKDNTDDTDVGKRSIEVACSNNGHPVYIKTLAGVGAEISATDDGSVIHIVNPSNKSLEFHHPLITNMDTVMNERFEYKSVLQEEKFAQSNPEYKTTVVTSDVRYDPTDPTKVVETRTLTSSGSVCTLTHGNLSCSSAAGYGFALPGGNWINECYGSHYDGVTLTAVCRGLEQSQFATPGSTSNCTIEGSSLTCTDKGFNYPSGTSNYEKSLYPSWLSWNFKKDHFGGDILLSAVSGQSGYTSTTLAASGSQSYCDAVGVNGFLSCKPNALPLGNWLNHSEIVSSFYDGYNLTIRVSSKGGEGINKVSTIVSPDSGTECDYSGGWLTCK